VVCQPDSGVARVLQLAKIDEFLDVHHLLDSATGALD
jgi:hypothetical protein